MFFVIYVINFRSFLVLKYVEAEYGCVLSVDGFKWTLFHYYDAYSNLHRYAKVSKNWELDGRKSFSFS